MKNTIEIYHPWRTFNALAQHLLNSDRLQQNWGQSPKKEDAHEEVSETFWSPTVEVSETDAHFQITAELPQVTQEQVKVTVDHGLLTLSGERTTPVRDEKSTLISSERVYGKFRRAFRLPEKVDAEAVSAAYKDGLLTITLPKKPEAKAREITVLSS
jgi:HSP20 family protein